MPHGGDKQAVQLPRGTGKKIGGLLVFELISILNKAKSGQTKSEMSLISVYCLSDH